MYLLSSACHDEHGDVTWFKHSSVQNINMSDVENFAVRFQTGFGVLFHERGVDLELCGREPKLEDLDVAFDIGIEDFREDVLAHIPQEGFELEVGVDFAELLDYLGGLVLGEEAGEAVGDGAGGGDERVLGFFVGVAHAVDALEELGIFFEVVPRLSPRGVFVESDVGAGAEDVRHVI